MSPPKPTLGSKRSCPKKNPLQLRRWEQRDVMVGVEREGGTSPPKPMPGSEKS